MTPDDRKRLNEIVARHLVADNDLTVDRVALVRDLESFVGELVGKRAAERVLEDIRTGRAHVESMTFNIVNKG